MTQNYTTEFRDLPLDSVQEDPNQPRSKENTETDRDRLRISIKAIGMQQSIAVTKLPNGYFKIIDGHRRYNCAKDMGLKVVPCCIYPELEDGELERIRFELQNNRRPWKPDERADALSRIKKTSGLTSNKDLANLLFISETMISNSLNLNKQNNNDKALMEEYDLPENYRIEFRKMRPKIIPIKEFSVDDIIRSIVGRYGRGLRSAKDFRTIGRIFLRATANQQYIYEFLKDEDMPVKALELNTIQSGFSLLIEQVIKKIRSNEKQGTPFSQQEKAFMAELNKDLNKVLK